MDLDIPEEVRDDYVFVFDTETTGLPDRNKHSSTKYYPPEELNHYDSSRIVSIAWMIFNKMGEVKYSRYAVIKPDDFVSSDKLLMYIESSPFFVFIIVPKTPTISPTSIF